MSSPANRNLQLITALLLVVLVAGVQTLTGQQPTEQELVDQLGGPDRYVTHISTDKPIYKAGEPLYVRALLIDALTRRPFKKGPGGPAKIEVLSPKGEKVSEVQAAWENSVIGWRWEIAEDLPGGDYKVKISFPQSGYAPAEREFNIRAYRQPRLRTQVEFLRKGYGPGEEVTATLEASRVEGGFPVGADATVVARVDRNEVYRGKVTIDQYGFATTRFTLPDQIRFGDGTLSFAIEDGGVIENASKTIPILVSVIDLSAYPEGGRLVAGLPNRVYFEAIAPNGRPADVTVKLFDSSGNDLAKATTEHEGRGSFEFTPRAGEKYTLKVVQPWTVKTEVLLDEAEASGILLRTPEQKYGSEGPVVVSLGTTDRSDVLVQLSHKEHLVAEKSVILGMDRETWKDCVFDVPKGVAGVLRVTVFDLAQKGIPVAERLIYREPANRLNVAVEPDREGYVPGERVTLNIKTTDINGNAVAGFVGLTVTDDGTLEMVETREQIPHLPEQVYLENDVRELKDFRAYLGDDENSQRALDLLLGTQGWRRFVYADINGFIGEHGDKARRALAYAEPVRVVYRRGGMMDDGLRLNMMAAGAEAPAAMPMDKKKPAAQKPVNAVDLGEVDGIDAFGGGEEIAANEPVDLEREIRAGDEIRLKEDAQAGLRLQLADRDDANMEMGAARVIAAEEAMFDMRQGRPAMATVAVYREYAHPVRPDRMANDRVDFTETLFWSAWVETGKDGTASVTFDLSDSVTSFRAKADAWTGFGKFGFGETLVESRRPFYVEIKAPLETTDRDELQIPIVLVNETDTAKVAGLIVDAGESLELGEYPESVELPARSRVRVLLPATVISSSSDTEILVSATTGDFDDHVTRQLSSVPRGFPINNSFGGLVEEHVSHALEIPASYIQGSVRAYAQVYPTPVGNLTSALEALIRDPNGCFEQTSSTNYPLVMAMQYFETHTGVDPDLIRRSREKLDAGYKKLVGFECSEKGYEWFGGDPGHEALTAYGLLEFSDMAQVQPVDPEMMTRTREWLLGRRNGEGGFERNSRALDSFGGAPDDITNAYVTWALCLSGDEDLTTELNALRDLAYNSEDPYLVSLVAGALIAADRPEDAAGLLGKLVGMQDEDGSLGGATTSITRSGGQSLLIETTSLASLAWMSDSQYAPNLERAMQWLCTACEGGRFGSTQSTVMALKAIVEYDKLRAHPPADGILSLVVDGDVLEKIVFNEESRDALEFQEFGAFLWPGEHQLELRMEGGGSMPYAISVEYFAENPNSSDECPVVLETMISESSVKEGEPVEVIARLINTTDEGLPMTMAIVGLPGGLEPRHEQLKELVKEGVIDFYEVMGRDIAIYFRDLEPNASKEIVISVIGGVPGTYTGPASRSYLYYTPEQKQWIAGMTIEVKPGGE